MYVALPFIYLIGRRYGLNGIIVRRGGSLF
jgi:hypothetical protein